MAATRRLPVLVAAAMLAAALTPAVLSPAPAAARARPAARRCPRARYGPRYYAPGHGKTVALTFDDGPGRSTRQILRLLEREHVPATFFNVGSNELARWWLVKAEVRAGFAVGNHTWSHPYLPGLSRSGQQWQIDRTSAGQQRLTGRGPCSFRPPYGAYNRATLQLARHRGLMVWLWSVDTEDWQARGSGSAYWVHRIIALAKAEGGQQRHPVVLLHNQPAGNPATVRALPAIIAFFRRHHYRFVRL